MFLQVALCSACRKPKGKQASSGHQAKTLAEKVAAVSCFSFDVEKELADAGERLDTLSKDESESADRALVMLLGYYLGEHNSEELQIEIVRRGKRMKPLLIQEQKAPALLSTCAPRNKADLVGDLANDAIKTIDQSSSNKQVQ